MTLRVRFAPSPTGFLHIGNARTAVFNWLYAKRHGGRFVVRIEDTDTGRHLEEAVKVIEEGLTWLGLSWDEYYRQSQRLDLYRTHLDRLRESGAIYRCYATREELDLMRALYREGKSKSSYDRRWRDKGPADWPADQPYVWRFKMPLEGEVRFDDLVQGEVAFQYAALEDYVLARSDGTPLYNFCVVVDDHLMDITDVIRGADHLSNTPLQIALYHAFGWTPPRFGHLGLVHGPDGQKYSKRHGAVSIAEWREMGFLPHTLRNGLARLGWSHGDQELFTDEELTRLFDLRGTITRTKKDGKIEVEENAVLVNPGAAILNLEKLKWLNQQKLKTLPYSEIAPHWIEWLAKDSGGIAATIDDPRLPAILDLLRERVKDLRELAAQTVPFFRAPTDYDTKAVAKLWADRNAAALLLGSIADMMDTVEPFTKEPIEAMFHTIGQCENKKLGELAQPVRLAVTGSSVSPPLFESMAILGRDEVISRLRRAMAWLKG